MRGLAVLAMAGLLTACGGGDGGSSLDDDPVLRPGDRVEVSKACQEAFVSGHDREKAGDPTPAAFLPSVQSCSSLAEWSAAARNFGVRLNGQDARFVGGVCAVADAGVQALPICQQAKAEA